MQYLPPDPHLMHCQRVLIWWLCLGRCSSCPAQPGDPHSYEPFVSRIKVCMLNISPLNGSAQQALLCAGMGPATICTCTSSLAVCVQGRLAVQIWCTVIYCPYAALRRLCACTACHDLLRALMVTSAHSQLVWFYACAQCSVSGGAQHGPIYMVGSSTSLHALQLTSASASPRGTVCPTGHLHTRRSSIYRTCHGWALHVE